MNSSEQSDSDIAEEIKQKNRDRYKLYRQNQLSDPEKATEFKKRRAKQTSDYRKRLMLNRSSGYLSQRCSREAGKRFESKLPKDFQKRSEIIRILGSKYLDPDAEPKVSKTTSSNEGKPMNTMHQQATDFFLRDDISRQMPGMKDFVVVRNQEGEKEKLQKRFMTMTCQDAWEIYKSNYENFLPKSTFYSLRPEHVLLASNTPHLALLHQQ
jgi:hypothetical protein